MDSMFTSTETRRSRSSRLLPVALVLALSAAPRGARADDIRFGPHDVPTVFFISKSDDHNRVDYAIRLAEDCVPMSNDAVFPYWRELEKTPVFLHPINLVERVPYGISSQGLLTRFANGADYFLRLRALDRVITIALRKQADGSCTATPHATIHGVASVLFSVFAKVAWPMSVDYIDIHGKDAASGAPVNERVIK
jgi:hypothetical protein